MTLDFSRCRPVAMPDGSLSFIKDHAKIGVQHIVNHPFFALFDEMGAMKTAQAIISACFLREAGVIDKVIVVAPSAVKSVWYDPDYGELKRHLFEDIPAIIQEQGMRQRSWTHGPNTVNRFPIVVTNYELIRRGKNWLNQLLETCGQRTLLILDEATAVKNWKSLQTKACMQLRRACGRVLLLNGTPNANSPLDMFSQGNLMSPDILQCPYITYFRARYEVRVPVKRRDGKVLLNPYGKPVMTNNGWVNLDDLQRRFAPYVLRRLKSECLDLPAKLPPVTVTVELNTSWPHYQAMKKEMVSWLSSNQAATAQTAAIKTLRLAQITSGFIGGIESFDLGQNFDVMDTDAGLNEQTLTIPFTKEIGREKLDAFLDWLSLRFEEDPNLKLLVQCRFRAELARVTLELRQRYPNLDLGEIVGGQKKQERQDALRLMDPRSCPTGPAVVSMSSAGNLGLNLTAAHTVARLSRDYSLWLWQQGEDRVHRPGQVSPVSYTDFVARGPKGQRTIDHVILDALMAKKDIATFVTSEWVKALEEE